MRALQMLLSGLAVFWGAVIFYGIPIAAQYLGLVVPSYFLIGLMILVIVVLVLLYSLLMSAGSHRSAEEGGAG